MKDHMLFSFISRILFSVGMSLAVTAPAWATNQPDFSKAIRVAKGPLLSGKGDVAALFKNPDNITARLEVWGWRNGSFEKLAVAPKAGCFDCAGSSLRNEWMPSSINIQNGELIADYHGGSGQEKWSWRTQWVWDFILNAPRARAIQRLGTTPDNQQRFVMADFISGEQVQKMSSSTADLKCRIPSFSAPDFEELSLKSLFQGQLEPGCIAGSQKGNALAAVPRIQAAFAEDILGQKQAKQNSK